MACKYRSDFPTPPPEIAWTLFGKWRIAAFPVAPGNLEVGILISASHWPLDCRIEIIEETGKILKDPSTNSSMKEWALKERSEQKPPPMLTIHLSPAPLSMRSRSGFQTLPQEG
jgi:hypothetical protein